MSAEFEDSPEKDGFLKCKDCPRGCITKFAFENHSSTQHNQEIQTKLDQLPQPPAVKYQSAFFLCNLSFESETDLQQHGSSEHDTPLRCKKSFSSKWVLQRHIDNVHKKLKPFQCQECKIYFGQKQDVQRHMNTVQERLSPYKCQECKKSFSQRDYLQIHNNTVHKKLTPLQWREHNKDFGVKSNDMILHQIWYKSSKLHLHYLREVTSCSMPRVQKNYFRPGQNWIT